MGTESPFWCKRDRVPFIEWGTQVAPVAKQNFTGRHAVSPFWFLVSFTCIVLVYFCQYYFCVFLSVCNVIHFFSLEWVRKTELPPLSLILGHSKDFQFKSWGSLYGRDGGLFDKDIAELWVPYREPEADHCGGSYGETDNFILFVFSRILTLRQALCAFKLLTHSCCDPPSLSSRAKFFTVEQCPS